MSRQDASRERARPADTDGVALPFATTDDTPIILGLIRELADYERLAHESAADEQKLRRSLFGRRSRSPGRRSATSRRGGNGRGAPDPGPVPADRPV